MSSIYKQVATINQIAGKELTADRELLLKQCDIIQSELNETYEALLRKDFPEFRDGVSDIEFTSLGLFALSPFLYGQDMQTVCTSNMQKFDVTEADALATRAKYAAIGIRTYYDVVPHSSNNGEILYYVTKSACDQTDHSGKFYPEDKWLKSHKWSEPLFLPISRLSDKASKEYKEQFEQELDDCVHNTYAARSLVMVHLEKSGPRRVLELLERGLEAEQTETKPLLMSVANPNGWKLEELLEKVAVELEEKNAVLTEQCKAAPQVSDLKFMTMMSVSANNAEIVESLKSCAVIQRWSMAAFDNLGPDQGPTGTPRV